MVYIKIKKLLSLLVLMSLLIFQSCENTDEEALGSGDIKSSSFQITLNETSLKMMAEESDIPDFAIFNYAATVVSIEYYTEGKDGETVPVSGALFIPVNNDENYSYTDDALPMLSLQHGTVFGRNDVASVSFMNSREGLLALISAMGGIVTAVPDYIGFGISQEMHPYIIEELTANAVIDFLRAAEDYCADEGIKLNGKLALAGYSEGGFCTMATQKAIETKYSDEFNLVYSVPMSGPYDLPAMVDYIFSEDNYAYPSLMSFILTSYNHYYDWDNLDEIFQSPYNTQVNSLFSGDNGYTVIKEALPDSMHELIKSEFIDSYLAGNQTKINDASAENCLIDNWTPVTPMMLIHGNADDTVPYLNSVNAYNKFKDLGAPVTFETVEGGTHFSTVIPALEIAFTKILQEFGK